ncbi:hypothetical protein MKW94_008252, partial [Papaver nudicaule]|nr:hypothetical protein [Papaver nudicaule]
VESDDGNQTRGESHGDGKQGNGSGKGTSEIETKAEDFINRFKQQLQLQRLESIARYKEIVKTPTSANISERGKGKEVSVEEKSGTEKVVSKSLKMSDPVSQEGEGIDNSM